MQIETSIIMPCYAMGRFMPCALRSISEQSYRNWELVAVDDAGPEDGTRGLVEEFRSQHLEQRVVYLRHSTNKGVSAARNTAIENSRGSYLAFLDPDDFWSKDYLCRMIGELENKADVVYTAKTICNEQGIPTGSVDAPTLQELEDFPISLHFRNYINPSCAVLRKSCLPELRAFDEAPEMQHHEDWDLWLRLAHECGAKYSYVSSGAVSYYRRHPGAATGSGWEKFIQRRCALWKKHASNPLFAHSLAVQLGGAHRKIREMEMRSWRQKLKAMYRCKFGWGNQ